MKDSQLNVLSFLILISAWIALGIGLILIFGPDTFSDWILGDS